MISNITLKNFKIFNDEINFPFSKVNLLTGINGRGKSTLLQSMLLFKQTSEQSDKAHQISINGSAVSLGSFSDIRNTSNPQSLPVEISFAFEFKNDSYPDSKIYLEAAFKLFKNDEEERLAIIKEVDLTCYENSDEVFSYFLSLVKDDSNSYNFKSAGFENYPALAILQNFYPFVYSIPDEANKAIKAWIAFGAKDSISFQKIHYVPADRIGPSSDHIRPTVMNTSFVSVGSKAANTVNVLHQKKDNPVHEILVRENYANQLIRQTEAWMEIILSKANIDLSATSNNINFSLGGFKPENVGFGFSYVLPIIVAGLIAEKGEIIIVENPEAHLHPKAQSEIAKFLALVSFTGVQIFIESHSEHILNGLRIASLKKNQIISHNDISVFYFKNSLEEPYTLIKVSENGVIENWPDNFFDQSEKDYSTLFK